MQLGKISRTQIDGIYIYGSADKEKAASQLSKRLMFSSPLKQRKAPRSEMIQIEILVEIIRASKINIAYQEIALRLVARGIKVTCSDVEETVLFLGLKKKRNLS